MRVLQINSIFDGGGVDNQTLELCKGLLAAGVAVSLAVRDGARMVAEATAIAGLEVQELPAPRGAFVRALAVHMRRWKPDVVHAHHGRDYWPAILAARLSRGRPCVVVSRHLMNPNSAASRLLLLRVADMATVSKAVYAVQNASLHGPRTRLHQIYGGVDCTRFVPCTQAAAVAAKAAHGWPPGAVVFGVIGYFNPPRGKGQMEFLQAAARLHHVQPDARFLVVGAGGLLQAMQAFVAAHGLNPVVRIVDWQADVRRVLAAMDVVVYPAVEPEALGIVLWEALACGLPVIASDLGGLREAFEDGRDGVLVPPADIDALARAMRQLAADHELRRRYGAAGRQRVLQCYSTAAHTARMLALYRSILGRGRQQRCRIG